MGETQQYTVMYLAQCKWNLKVVVNTRLHLQMIIHGTRLFQAKLPLEFWAEVCSTAVYLHNRSPTTALKDETPFERYEDAFMEEVRNLPPVRERRMPRRFCDKDCLLVDSDIDEPKTVQEALNGEQSVQWRKAMESENSSLLKCT